MTTCAKCGAENAAGDAFCGSCGAFLEFAAEEAAETTPPVAPEGGEVGAGEGVTPRASDGGAARPAPATAAPAPAPAADAGSTQAASGPTCASCGRVNPAGRKFCITCGERLSTATAAGVTATGAAPAATASVPAATPSGGGAPARPTWDFPTAPAAAAAGQVAQPATRTPTAGGRSRLPLVIGLVAVVALVGGGAVVLLGGGLGGSAAATGSPAASSAVASGVRSAGASAEPGTAVPGGTPSGEQTGPTAAPATIPPGPAVGVKITSAKASSQLSTKRSAANLFDGSPATSWKSKSGQAERSWVEVAFDPAAVTRIQVWGGWQVDQPTFYGNHRPRNVTVSFDGGDPVPLELKDILGAQRIDIPPELGIARATTIRITILDTYPSRKTSAAGSPTKEVAISEIRIFGIPVTP